MANTENIEAKLCAYVDGDIDDAARAEIEAHLASNPQHRQLLEELRGQRALLSGLPRARAPEDLSDAFQSQLERSVLLDGAQGHPEVAGRINRAPQMIAVAAVLILGIGLAAVIYMVLPARNQSPRVAMHNTPSASSSAAATTAPTGAMREFAADTGTAPMTSKSAATQPAAESALAMRDQGNKDVQDKFVAARSRAGESLVVPVPPPPTTSGITGAAGAVAMAPPPPPVPPPAAAAAPSPAAKNDIFASKSGPPGAADNGPGLSTATNIFANPQPLDAKAAEKLKQAPGVPDDAAVVVVASDNPTATNQQVQQYLERNGIQWEPVSEPMPPPIEFGQSQVVAPSRLQNNVDMHLKGGFPPEQQQQSSPQKDSQGQEDVNRQKQQQNLAENGAVEQQQQRQIAQPRWSPGDRPIREGKVAAGAGAGSGIASADRPVAAKAEASTATAAPAASPPPPAANASALGSAAPTTSRAFDAVAQQSQQPAAIAGSQPVLEQAMPQQQQQQAAPQQVADAAGQQQQRLIIARGLTAKQVAELNFNIASNNAGRVIDYRRSASNGIDETRRVGGGNIGGQGGSSNGAGSNGSAYGGGGYGFPAASKNPAAPATQPSTTVALAPSTVATDAEALRNRQRTPVAGQPSAGPTTAPATGATTTQSAVPPIAGIGHAQPATAAAVAMQKASGPATQPLTALPTATTQPAAAEPPARIDVVICVQPAAQNGQQPAVLAQPGAPAGPAAPATAPTAAAPKPAATQPATSPTPY